MQAETHGESFRADTRTPPVAGFLHRPMTPSGHGLLLTHGAGGNAGSALLMAITEVFAAAGFAVLRCNLPRQARKFGPPRRGDAARDREGLKNAIGELRKVVSGRLFVGGQSYGGRQASMLIAEEHAAQSRLADGLLLLSYPLHAPGRPDQPRTEHLPQIDVPVLFVHGTRDPFGTIDEIEAARKLVPSKTDLLMVDGVGHDLGFKGKIRREDLSLAVLERFKALFT